MPMLMCIMIISNYNNFCNNSYNRNLPLNNIICSAKYDIMLFVSLCINLTIYENIDVLIT